METLPRRPRQRGTIVVFLHERIHEGKLYVAQMVAFLGMLAVLLLTQPEVRRFQLDLQAVGNTVFHLERKLLHMHFRPFTANGTIFLELEGALRLPASEKPLGQRNLKFSATLRVRLFQQEQEGLAFVRFRIVCLH